MRGNYYSEYFINPDIQKPPDQIFEDMDYRTLEIFPEQPADYESIDFWVLLPPLILDGHFVKGLYFSQGVDVLNQQLPELKDYFVSIATSRWCSYPWSKTADALFTLHPYPEREAWFRQRHPERAHQTLIPWQGADFLSEYRFPPQEPPRERDLDLICVSTLAPGKNVPFLARCLKVYRQKYSRPLRMTLVMRNKLEINARYLDKYERSQYKEMESILVHVRDYIDLIPRLAWFDALPAHYARAKIAVLGSLIEGSNRSLREAIVCDTPVLYNTQYNQYVRGSSLPFPEGTGLAAPFDPESWADTLHTMLSNYGELTPRAHYLKSHGRANFLNACMEEIPYYRDNLPHYSPGGHHHENLWLNVAMQQCYQTSFWSHLHSALWITGLPNITARVQNLISQLKTQRPLETKTPKATARGTAERRS